MMVGVWGLAVALMERSEINRGISWIGSDQAKVDYK